MSTNAIIKVEGIDFVMLYKHWDGYPGSTLPWLEEFNEDFKTNRGNDPEYKFAQLLRSSERDGDKFEMDRCKHTGWGVLPYEVNTDAPYEYILNEDGTVTVNP